MAQCKNLRSWASKSQTKSNCNTTT